ncbi:hypothetical protein GFS24_01985 [Chitinophaga sp. SYP-B3965]|uniref:capsule assembly Wzi family protein n=1 Tax=Chitinophaga sp. SYP-B3965 TaxID=2663120 RepID=UPI001299C12B|nr:capsule assembly Wzi family protein [Chitinophaga sp. SYP-B3965]MRG43861.1 hypothetical protein [Chitinophaga sp. SYP-B3965]
MQGTKLLIIFILLSVSGAQAQFADSLEVKAGTTGTIASKDYQPLWLVSNRFGVISDRKGDLSTHAMFSNKHVLNENFYIRYGLSLYNNNQFKDVFIQEGFLKAGYKKLEFRAGRYEEMIGELDKDLSSGSWGISGNARPIPKIGFALTDYVDIPFTNGWLQFKGQISHGWMGKDQYIPNAFLHEKTFYVRIGKKQLKVYGGLQHYALWGGNRADLPKINSSFKDFWNVFIGKEGNDGTVVSPEFRPNRPGDHRGVLEGGITWENDNMLLHVYNQSMFETGQGITLKNKDRLLGFSYSNKNKLLKLTAEYITTKQMNDFFPLNVRESYYNNGIYLTGWEYKDRIIGTPLFINKQRGQHYFDDIKPFDWSQRWDSISGKGWNIINNRITGIHLGAMYALGSTLKARTLLTYTKNYGNYLEPRFEPALKQWYTLQEVTWQTPLEPLTLTAGAAVDWGDIYSNAGFMLGVQWKFNKLNQ